MDVGAETLTPLPGSRIPRRVMHINLSFSIPFVITEASADEPDTSSDATSPVRLRLAFDLPGPGKGRCKAVCGSSDPTDHVAVREKQYDMQLTC